MNAFGRGASPAIPDTVAHLDADVVVETLSRHANNVSAAADELGVASADLRRLCHARPQLQAVAAEMEERELDLAEANISGFLRSKDDRLRLAASMFKIRNSVRARRRGWITSSAASVDVNLNANQPPQRIIVTWRNPNGTDDDDDDNTETIERDGKRIPVPCYGRTPDDCLEGEVATPAAMIGHQADAEPEPEQVAVEPVAIEPVAPLPTLLKWHDPYSGPPPLVAHLYQPHVPKPRGGPPQPSQPRKVIYE